MTKRSEHLKNDWRANRWSLDEDLVLREFYPDYGVLREQLPHRTLPSIKHRVRALGIAHRRHVWTNLEVARLQRAFAEGAPDAELTKLFPGLRLSQITSMAYHIRAEQRMPPLAHFDEPALDVIRARSRAMRISFVELDRQAGTGRYFQKSTRRPSLKSIVLAARVLEGEVRIEWADDF